MRRVARGGDRVLRARIARKSGRALGVGTHQLAFQLGQAIALCEPRGGGRGRVAGSGIAVPAPQIAFGRDQTLTRL